MITRIFVCHGKIESLFNRLSYDSSYVENALPSKQLVIVLGILIPSYYGKKVFSEYDYIRITMFIETLLIFFKKLL